MTQNSIGRRSGVSRRRVLGTAAALPFAFASGKAPAQVGQARPFQGTTINVSCWSAPYPQLLQNYLPEFTERTGIRVNYDTPGFPIYNQRADLELSTRGTAFDVLNVTFIYISRWINAGWFTPLDEFIRDANKTPADWDFADFLPGLVTAFKNRQGQVHAVPWTADCFMSGAARFDLIRAAGMGMPDTFEELERMCAAVNNRDGCKAFITENTYSWPFVPFLQGFGGNVFRNAPDDLMPTLDTPEAIQAAEYFGRLLREYGPEGAISYTQDQGLAGQKQGRINYSTMNQALLVQLGDPATSRVTATCNFSMAPRGPAGRFPGIATHGWGIPAGARNKDAAWEFIKWSLSKDLIRRMMQERSLGSVTRQSIIGSPEFRQRLTVNGVDIAKIFTDTIATGADGHMAYRTVHVFPQANNQIVKAIENVVSGQMAAREAMRQAQANTIADLRRAGVRL